MLSDLFEQTGPGQGSFRSIRIPAENGLPVNLKRHQPRAKYRQGEQHGQRLDEVSAVPLGPPHEDVAVALSRGFDGDRTLLEPPPVSVI
jgi:hypothetical protein